MKKFNLAFLTLLIVLSFSVISNAYSSTISAENDIEATNEKHYPVALITNNRNVDITVEWGAYGDEFQGNILVPANTTVSLELPQLSFLGNNHETTTIWLTWNEENVLKPRGVDLITIPFNAPENNDSSVEELG
ncbi:hypothetical protein CHL78_011950 [Romboutsia weinsteinii]|uniref:Uncharacterized protein n=1 Tax=Romboutsia weinsteinii TaxID=2020949 RepID=A0A371J282_9FIRM|nr:hypothetical protein [Romboutsia weinsteinii]RDY26777.1 hypothetical protein CHL78_011950 [Romboutsia weinsteinii]